MPEEDMQREGEQKGPGADDGVDVGVDPGHKTSRRNCGMELEAARAAVFEAWISAGTS